MTMVVSLLRLFNFLEQIYTASIFFNTVSQPYPGTLTAQLNEAQPTKNNHSVFL